ncbi:MAG: adenylate kinase [Candidatus Bipolaricaulota bacterium]|nr:adenylate kinase [Candidatus Bipolaricaulota bacterium]MCS7275054.1 adenylate kinase [Candidatus Bipolaricaulota bacterium]MDW8110382.1 adenylate kinase [Candidatus Bipolaricaulota bacterium]MDW8329547.1 adenylate kinase [Candidatus Bipolaricaulota bacterium]
MVRKIVFLGPPGAGKGTQAVRLAQELGVPHIATGDLLRAEVQNQTELGMRAKSYMDRGELVPDELVVAMIRGRLEKASGFVLDGFPRNLSQAQLLNGVTRVERAVLFSLSREEIVKRLSARRLCPQCGQIYNLLARPPKHDEICDACHTRLMQRSDDRPEVIENRVDIYTREIQPVLEFYQNQSVLREVDARGSVEEVYRAVKAAVS